MKKAEVFKAALGKFHAWYGTPPRTAAYAPGRVEILGNHTDYNEGFVLSAAINFGTFFLASKCDADEQNGQFSCRLVAGDLMKEVIFPINNPRPFTNVSWPNYIMGVAAELAKGRSSGSIETAFKGLFFGNVPLGSGLSSSAALEISTGLALADLYGLTVESIDLARIGQKAEHDYVGAKTGLLDQISSLFGKKNHLVLTDFRTLEVQNVPLPSGICFLVCDTGTKHNLGESAYNERREACERAAEFFSSKLDHAVTALRDVSTDEWKKHSPGMDNAAAKRSSHVIGENSRVLKGKDLLESGALKSFGELMFKSHESSRVDFENSCAELDFLVDAAKENPNVLGARLSGGGFGGSAVMLVDPAEVSRIVAELNPRYEKRFGGKFEPRIIEASEGAHVVPLDTT